MDLRVLSRAALLIAFAACRAAPAPSTTGETRPPADSIVNPLAGNKVAADDGEKLFYSMNCDGCHGPGALGFVGPNLVDGRWRFGGSDAEVYQSILKGRAQGMPAYGEMLSEATIWQIVTYLKSQPVPVDVATEAWP